MVVSKQNITGKDPVIIQFPVPRGTCDMSAHGRLSFAGIRMAREKKRERELSRERL